MTRKVLAQGLACVRLVEFERFPVAYDSPVPIDMNRDFEMYGNQQSNLLTILVLRPFPDRS